MPLFLLPSTALFPRLYDELFDDDEPLERSLRHHAHQAPPPKQRRTVNSHRGRAHRSLDKITNDDSKFAISFNVGKFKLEDLKVDLEGRTLIVEGKQEIKDDGQYSLRCFTKKWELPEDVDLDQIKPTMTDDGCLTVEAPKITKPSATSRSIPIQKAVTENCENSTA
ncbi:Hsp20/alpha crystallin family protein [Ancylostoma caninum]|uniref:Hsp20/alpha crystallin family protein n=1 Tax=Ancylostoma caninum TaxID=29170 RepID=A0A368H4E7_ANCCA|nr:Hsp20/alpha crystallin family protein [Ancylostoma caninum]